MTNPLLAAFLALFLIAGAFGAGNILAAASEPAAVAAALPRIDLDPARLEAQAAVVYDPATGETFFSKNAQTQLPLASLTKLMSAYAVLSERPPSTVVRITADDLKPDGDWGLSPGDELSIDQLLRLGLVASCNDCMAAAASSLGSGYLAAMNDASKNLGLSRTYFLNSTGLDLSDDAAGAYGSAFDVARLTASFYKKYPQYFELSTKPSVSIEDGARTLSDSATTVPLQDLPGFVGGKTGYTDLAGGNLTAVFDLSLGHPVVAVVLHSTESGRFEDIRTLIEALRASQ